MPLNKENNVNQTKPIIPENGMINLIFFSYSLSRTITVFLQGWL